MKYRTILPKIMLKHNTRGLMLGKLRSRLIEIDGLFHFLL